MYNLLKLYTSEIEKVPKDIRSKCIVVNDKFGIRIGRNK